MKSRFAALAAFVSVAISCSGVSSPSSPPPSAHNLTPVISNQWYSNLYSDYPTQPLYALPGVFQLRPEGLAVSVPRVTKSADSVVADFHADLVLGMQSPLERPVVTNVGDWSVGLSMSAADGKKLSFTLAHGVPFTVLHVSDQTLQVSCIQSCSVLNDSSTGALRLTIGPQAYVIATDHKIKVKSLGSTLLLTGADRYFFGLLDDPKHLGLFQSALSAEILGTTAKAEIVGPDLRTTYAVQSPSTPLLALYPHQARFLTSPAQVLGSYATIRGDLVLVRAASFATTMPVQRPPANFAPLSAAPADLAAALERDVNVFMAGGPPASRDYYLGVWFGRGIDLLQVAQAVGRTDLSDRLVKYLEPQLVSGLSHFHYVSGKTSVIADSPEFGNQNLNDHHFHYGYFIRAGAILALADPAYASQIRSPVQQMVSDIATYDRASSLFPYLRTFDIYEGHSWADGFARFGAGNDQESSSEAINAWYATYLWSQVVNDPRLETAALYLYTTEVQSTKDYWFGASGVYSAPYRHHIASIVWGGKADFATWFSRNPNAIYGIQLVAFTPASTYLGQLGGIEPYLADLEASGGSLSGYWGDLFVGWLSFYSPQRAVKAAHDVPDAQLFGPRSLLLYLVYRNSAP